MTPKKTLLYAVIAIFALAGCGETNNDADKGENDKAPADIMAFPNGFSNIAHKCDGPNMVYSSTNGSDGSGAGSNRTSIAAVKDDPRCLAKFNGGGLK